MSVRYEARIAAHLARKYRAEYRKGDDAASRIAVAYRMCLMGLLRVLKQTVAVETETVSQ